MVTYTLAGGCFWCLDAVYRRLKGVHDVMSVYTGGDLPYPTYDQVSMGTTGHAEAARITFNDKLIPTEVILDIFFLIHDPTTLNRQGNDIGTQYRSAMFYEDDEQKEVFEAALKRAQEHWDDPIVTELKPLGEFYLAETHHQNYFENNPGNPYCSVVIEPKIIKTRARYSKWFKEDT